MKTFGIVLIVVAALCGIGALTQTSESDLEKANQNVVSTSEHAIKTLQEGDKVAAASARLQGEAPPTPNAHFDEDMGSLTSAAIEADALKTERTQRMMLWIAGAAVCFLAGIICIATSKKSTPSAVPQA